jgi:hypothetical protein
MSRLSYIPKIVVVAMAMMIVLSSFQGPVAAQSAELDPIVIMYEAGHSPQFAADNAANGLKLMLDMVNASTRYIVRVNEDTLNKTILSDVDVLIIASPDVNSEFEYNETVAISSYLANGSSLLLMGDPVIDQNSTYWLGDQLFQDLGENVAVNNLLDQLNITGVRFSANETDIASIANFGDSMFDYEHCLNTSFPAVISLDTTTWDTAHPIFRDINSLLTMTATLKPIGLQSGIARGYDTSFAQFRKGPNTFANLTYPNMTLAAFAEKPLSYSAINGTFPAWLSAFEYDSSRIVIVGSTIMFTGRFIDITDSEQQWFYQGDNARLFMNIMSWLSEEFVESPDAILPMAIISSVILTLGLAVYIVKKMR